MPRKPRFYMPDFQIHIVQRGHSQEAAFFENDDHTTYLHWVYVAADRYDCAIHACVLMTNHIHFLVTPNTSRVLVV